MEDYKISEVSRILRRTPRTIHSYIKQGKFNVFKVNCEWRITEKAIMDFSEACNSIKEE